MLNGVSISLFCHFLGTPGPNSSRSSLSALTFLDEPDPPSPHVSLLKSVLRQSKDSMLSSGATGLADDKPDPPPKRDGTHVEVDAAKFSPSKPLGTH